MQLKLRHIVLFMVGSLLLIYANTPGGALLALAVLMQLALLIHNIELSRKSQLTVLKLFLISTPLFLFWGGIHSFMMIYFSEGQLLYFLMAFGVSFSLCFLLSLQIIFFYLFLNANKLELIATLQDAFNKIKEHRNDFIKSTLLLFSFSFLPGLSSDWKLVFAVMVTHLYLGLRPNSYLTKKALSGF